MDTARREQAVELHPGRQEFLAEAEQRSGLRIIPLFCEVPWTGLPPTDLYAHLRTDRGFLLESLEGSEKVARYSFICTDPRLVISIDAAGRVALTGDPRCVALAGSPEGGNAVEIVRSILQRVSVHPSPLPRFSGGLVGCFGYDLVYALHPLVQPRARDDLQMPVARFMLALDCIVVDHRAETLSIVSNRLVTDGDDPAREYEAGRSAIAAMRERIEALRRHPPGTPQTRRTERRPPSFTSSLSKEEFMQAVRRLKEHIYAGDIFQAVLSRRLSCPLAGDPFSVYRALRETNPSPYMYHLDFSDLAVVGSSPEMLVRVEGGRVMTVPIAGTRPRGATPEEDARLADELLADEKERAEHIMLVDLARNDVGAVCAYGSVALDEFMAIEKFSDVQHIVSTVSGTLRDGLDCFDVLASCFPAGTVSGAPKVRAMQLIDEVEGTRRGIYAGAVGYIDLSGAMDMAIAIRTIIVRDGCAHIQVGAGIVADSDPEREWYETESKGRALVRAIEQGAVT